jgi:Tfp pilus assembly protein PilF
VDPGLAEAHELLGGLYARKKQLPDAAREYAAALAIDGGSARVELRLGTVLAAAGDKDNAAIHLGAAAKSSDATIARQAEQALRDLGIR